MLLDNQLFAQVRQAEAEASACHRSSRWASFLAATRWAWLACWSQPARQSWRESTSRGRWSWCLPLGSRARRQLSRKLTCPAGEHRLLCVSVLGSGTRSQDPLEGRIQQTGVHEWQQGIAWAPAVAWAPKRDRNLFWGRLWLGTDWSKLWQRSCSAAGSAAAPCMEVMACDTMGPLSHPCHMLGGAWVLCRSNHRCIARCNCTSPDGHQAADTLARVLGYPSAGLWRLCLMVISGLWHQTISS